MSSIGRVINPVTPQIAGISPTIGKTTPSSGVEQFTNFLADGIHSVNSQVKGFEDMSDKFSKGGSVNVQELMMSGERADISLKLMVTLRNKAIEAYQEVMRMPV